MMLIAVGITGLIVGFALGMLFLLIIVFLWVSLTWRMF
jgi:hypothetical protein